MACTDKYKHVCFGDLEEYLRRDSYFSDFSKDEIDTIRRNLGFTTTLEDFNVIEDTYENIYARVQNNKLNVSCIYIINDFRTLYLENMLICGLDSFLPSKDYKIVLKPISSNSFDRKVYILSNDYNTSKWIVEYDITPKKLSDELHSMGTITYLCDEYNNSAYYDFKNIRFKKSMAELNKGATSYTEDKYLYTFDLGGREGSEFCMNNKLGPECTANVFLGKAINNTLDTECHHNLFFSLAVNNTFKYGTYNNYFKSSVMNCNGVIHDKELSEVTSSDTVKLFDCVNNELVIMYIDPLTLTYLIYQI